MRKIDTSQAVLVVEDSDEDFEMALRTFRDAGLVNPLRRCESGQEALDYVYRSGAYAGADEPRPGLILLDLNLPGVDGRMVLGKLKADQETKEIPVVVLTTSSDERDVSACYRMGANTYLQKPFDHEDLVQSLRRLKDYWFDCAILPKVS